MLPPYLADIQADVEGHARDLGLDFFPTVFEVLSYKQMNEVAAYGGFPTRYPHWRWGMDYEQLSKSYEYGLSKIYEMVINTNPSYAYLLEGNSIVDQKIVMAHVYAHVDFFKNNYFFSKTNRKMIDGMANHATRVRRHVERQGIDRVESFIDTCLSLENLIDPMAPFIARKAKPRPPEATSGGESGNVHKLRAKSYMDPYINPPEFLEAQRTRAREKLEQSRVPRFPEHPERDILAFLLEHAPLADWEREILEIVRDEAYYFAPQGQTKIMNEGWATYWHSKIMTERVAKASEIIDYADACAGVLATSPGRLNPYKLGVELFRHIEERWNKGRFGKEWNECEDMSTHKTWDKRLGLGRQKIFEVRKLYNDITFIDEFFTLEFCHDQKFYAFNFSERSGSYEIETREFKKVKDKLLFQLTNHGQPFIYVEDGNHDNRGELLLRHRHEGGADLKLDHMRDTLENVQRVWRRPVALRTLVNGKGRVFRYDGRDHGEKSDDPHHDPSAAGGKA
jgi:stage V sporulation protein R